MNGLERFKKAFSFQEPDRTPIAALSINSPVSSKILGIEAYTGIGAKTYQKKFSMIQNDALDKFYFDKATDEIKLTKKMDLDAYFSAGEKIFPLQNQMVEKIDSNKWKLTINDHWKIFQVNYGSGFAGERDSWIKQGGVEAFRKLVNELEKKDFSEKEYSFKIFDHIIEKIGDEIAIFGNADVSIPVNKSWFPIFLKATIKNPQLVKRYLDAKLKETKLLLKAQLERGIFGVWGGIDWASTKDILFSKDFFTSEIKPRLEEITSLCHDYGTKYVKHTDGNINKIIDELIIGADVDGLQAIEPNAGMDIFNLKETYKNRLTLLGNVDCSTTLVNGSKKEIKEEVKKLIHNLAPGGGYVLTSSNSIHSNVPPQKWKSMIKAAKEFGNYPISVS